jgi:antitoxin MazE
MGGFIMDTMTQNIYVTQTNVRKWGNSQGIRLSKEVMAQMNLRENDVIDIHVSNGKMTVEKACNEGGLSLKERLEAFYNKPIDKIYVTASDEVGTGLPVGGEIW